MKQNTKLQERLAVNAMVRLPRVTRRMWLHLDHHMDSWSIAPTYRYLAGRSGCSFGKVRRHLQRLEEEKIVELFAGNHRAIRLLLRYPLPDSVPASGMLPKDLPEQTFLPENSPMDHTRALFTHASLSVPTQRVWYHLDGFIERHGFAPTHRELAGLCECAPDTVRMPIRYLQIARVIQSAYRKPRGIRLLLRYPAHLRDRPFPPPEGSKAGAGPQAGDAISFE